MQAMFIFMIDRSGSMSSDAGEGYTKMTKTREALMYFITNLPPNAQYKVISYGSKCDFLTLDCEEGPPLSTFFASNPQ